MTSEGSRTLTEGERRALLEQFNVDIGRAAPPLGLRIGSLIALVLLVALPLVYFGVVAAIVWATWWHATHMWVFQLSVTRKAAVTLYVMLLVAGGAAVFFLLKPFFGRRPDSSDPQEPLELTEKDEPFLFAYVSALCRALRAPVPHRIVVDCEVNASAGFHDAKGGMLGKTRVLTLGLPLVGALTLSELTSVLAHEFGHFTQGGGIWLHMTIRRLVAWYERVVFERDAWDEKLEAAAKSQGRLAALAWGAIALLWVVRKLLFAVLWLGLAFASWLSRQLEFHADRFAARTLGATPTSNGLAKILRAATAVRWAHEGAQVRFETADELTSNFPEFVRLVAANTSDAAWAEVDAAARANPPSRFSTHPSHADRIAAARRAEVAGTLRLPELPATALFADHPGICVRATSREYARIYARFPATGVITPECLLRSVRFQDELGPPARRFFQYTLDRRRAFDVSPAIEPPAGELATLSESLRGLRKTIVADASGYARSLDAWGEPLLTIDIAQAADVALAADLGYSASDLGLPAATRDAAGQAITAARATMARLASTLEPFEKTVAARLNLALSLFARSDVHAAIDPDGEAAAEITHLLPIARALGQGIPKAIDLYVGVDSAVRLQRASADHRDRRKLSMALADQSKRLRSATADVVALLGAIAWPIRQAAQDRTLGSHLELVPDSDANLDDLIAAARGVARRFGTQWFHTIGRLAYFAERAERHLG